MTSLTGVWAQEPTNFANGASITPYTFTGETFYAENNARNTASELAKLVNGDDGDAGFFGGFQTRTGEDPSYEYSDWFVNSFTIDMSGNYVTSYKTIEMIWTMATADKYKIYGGTTAAEAQSKVNLLVTEEAKTYQAAETKTYTLVSAVSYPYLFFDFSEAETIGGNKGWGVQIREIKVIGEFTQVLTSIKLSNKLFASGSEADVTASAFDQLSLAYAGPVTYTVSPTTGASVSENTISFTSEALGTYTITGTDANSNSATAKVYFIGEAPALTNSGDDIELIQSGKSSSGQGAGWDGGYTVHEDWNLGGTKIFHASKVKKFYMTNPGLDASTLTGYNKLHLKLFSSEAKNGVVVNMESIGVEKSFNVPAGKWVTLEVPFTGGSAATYWIWIRYSLPEGQSDAEILVTDMYFSKDEATVSIIPSYPKTTYVTTAALDFTAVDGLDAYVATSANASSVTMTKVEAPVPAGTPLMLIGTIDTEYNVPVAATASAPEGNLLVAGDGIKSIGGDGNYDYILSSDGYFHRVSTAGVLAAGKAYLHLNSEPSANALNVVFDDETTGINNLTPALSQSKGVYFDLMGRKVAQPTKGLYIVNGRKVVIK